MNRLSPAPALGQQLAVLARPQNMLYGGLLSATVAIAGGARWQVGLLCWLSLLTSYALAATYNNIRDVRTDTLNKRSDNPLVGRGLSSTTLIAFSAANLVMLAISNWWLAQPASLGLLLAFLLLAIYYSHPLVNIQSRGWLAPLLLAMCYGAIPLLLGAAQTGLVTQPRTLILAGLQLVLLFPLLLAKDYKDEHGDRLTGKRTPLVRYGQATVRRAAFAAVLAAGLGCGLLALRTRTLLTCVALLAVYAWLVLSLHRRQGKLPVAYSKMLSLVLLSLTLLLYTA